MIEVSAATVAKALGLPESTPAEQVIAAMENGPPAPRFMRELGAAPLAASAPNRDPQPDPARRFLPELERA
jgi:hypothetical protein